jgi:hypothetical protein
MLRALFLQVSSIFLIFFRFFGFLSKEKSIESVLSIKRPTLKVSFTKVNTPFRYNIKGNILPQPL